MLVASRRLPACMLRGEPISFAPFVMCHRPCSTTTRCSSSPAYSRTQLRKSTVCPGGKCQRLCQHTLPGRTALLARRPPRTLLEQQAVSRHGERQTGAALRRRRSHPYARSDIIRPVLPAMGGRARLHIQMMLRPLYTFPSGPPARKGRGCAEVLSRRTDVILYAATLGWFGLARRTGLRRQQLCPRRSSRRNDCHRGHQAPAWSCAFV